MLDAPDILQSFLTVAYLYLSIVCIVVILLETKNPVRTMAWEYKYHDRCHGKYGVLDFQQNHNDQDYR